MSKTPFMQLYVSDYLGDTMHLTTEQHGAYLLLLMTMWRHEGILPNDDAKLARIARVNPKRWPLIKGDVLAFFTEQDGQLTHKRLAKELQKALSISQKRKNAGSLGGLAKSLKNNDQPLASAKQTLKHSQKPDTIKIKETLSSVSKTRGSRLPDDFICDQEFAMSEGLTAFQAEREAMQFRDYWIQQPGQKGVKLDWPATWRTWVRNSTQRRPPQNSAYPQKQNKPRTVGEAAIERIRANGLDDVRPEFAEALFGRNRGGNPHGSGSAEIIAIPFERHG